MPLSSLSTLKLTLHATFTVGGKKWHRELTSPGVIKLVSRVQDRLQEEAAFRKRAHVPLGRLRTFTSLLANIVFITTSRSAPAAARPNS